MANTEYNGWTNYQTWVVNLWLTNDSSSVDRLNEMAHDCLTQASGDIVNATYQLSKQIESDHDEFMPETTGVYADLLTYSLGMVNWHEIARYVIDEEYSNWSENNPECTEEE